jgi:hypothetical protein
MSIDEGYHGRLNPLVPVDGYRQGRIPVKISPAGTKTTTRQIQTGDASPDDMGITCVSLKVTSYVRQGRDFILTRHLASRIAT